MTEPEGAPGSTPDSRWARGLLAAAGILGAAGVALGAASAHLGGGDLARLAAEFLLFHAASIPGLLALGWVARRRVLVAATCLGVGATLFSADVAVLGFTGKTPVSGMAPLGGILLMIGWLLVAACAFAGRSRSTSAN